MTGNFHSKIWRTDGWQHEGWLDLVWWRLLAYFAMLAGVLSSPALRACALMKL
jgi:hypothetical protein